MLFNILTERMLSLCKQVVKAKAKAEDVGFLKKSLKLKRVRNKNAKMQVVFPMQAG